jgi:hypothetical protein
VLREDESEGFGDDVQKVLLGAALDPLGVVALDGRGLHVNEL